MKLSRKRVCLLIAAVMMCCQMYSARPFSFMGNVVSSDDSKACGIYEFTLNGDSSFDVAPRYTAKEIYANGGGVVVDGVFHYIRWTEAIGFVFPYYHALDLESGKQIAYSDEIHSNDRSYFAMDLAYNVVDKCVYGIFYNSDQTGYALATIDYSTLTRKDIGTLPEKLVALAADASGRVYGFGADGVLYSVSTIDATLSAIGSTGEVPSTKMSSAAVDPVTDELYWSVTLPDGSAHIYNVDKTTGKTSEIGTLSGADELVGLYIAPPAASDNAPDRAVSLEAVFPAGAMSGTVNFVMPGLTYGGVTLSGELDYRVEIGGIVVASGKAMAGAMVSCPVVVPVEGMAEIVVIVSNGHGDGPKSRIETFVGYGVPEAPADVVLEKGETGLKLSWTYSGISVAPDGGYVDIPGLTYYVVDTDGNDLGGPVSATEYTIEVTDGGMRIVRYGVVAVNHGKRGPSAMSNSVTVGSTVAMPYKNDFSTEERFGEMKIDDANGDGTKWTYNAAQQNVYIPTSKAADDWILTPPVALKKGGRYKLAFAAKNNNRNRQETVGSGIVAEGTTDYKMVKEGEKLPSGTDMHDFSDEFEVEADGLYRVGVRAMSAARMNRLVVDYISVEELASTALPDSVTGFIVTAAPRGALSATVSFNAPVADMQGNRLESAIDSIVVRRGDVTVFKKTDVAPGEKIDMEDQVSASGFVEYSAVAVMAGSEGRMATVKAYVGVDVPQAPVDVRAREKDGHIELTWSVAPGDTGVNGGYVDADALTYNIYKILKSNVVRSGVTGNSLEIDEALDGEQDYIYYGISAVSEAGEGNPTVSNILVKGDPYTLPFVESFPDAMPKWFWWSEATGTNGFDLDNSVSHDGDYGSVYFYAAKAGDEAMLRSGKISLAGSESPVMTFWYYAYPGHKGQLYVESMDLNEQVTEILYSVDYSNIDGTEGWRRAEVDLKALKDKAPMVYQFRAVGLDTRTPIAFDDVRFMDQRIHDLAVGIDCPAAAYPGDKVKVAVSVDNVGLADAGAFAVSVKSADGVVLAEKECAPLASGSVAVVDFDVIVPVLARETFAFSAAVDYSADENMANNTVSGKPLSVLEPECPGVLLTGEYAGNGVKLMWNEPADLLHHAQESFETYAAWTAGMGGWQSVDVDKQNTVATQGIQNPIAEKPGAFFVFNTDKCGQDVESGIYNVFKARTGVQTAACYGVQSGKDDDWLISPLLSGREQTISFFARSISNAYRENFEILYSLSENPTTSDFVRYTAIQNAENMWTRYMAKLPEGTKYFAIHLVSEASATYALLVDDVEYDGADWIVEGYDVYCNGMLRESVGRDVTSLEIESGNDYGADSWQVCVRYAGGACSRLSNEYRPSSGIDDTAADISEECVVYNLYGIRVADDAEGFRRLPSGMYICNGKKIFKR